MTNADQKTGNVAIDIVSSGDDKPDRVVAIGPLLKLLPHRLRHLVLHARAGSVIADHKKTELVGLRGPRSNLPFADLFSADRDFVSISMVRLQARDGNRIGPRLQRAAIDLDDGLAMRNRRPADGIVTGGRAPGQLHVVGSQVVDVSVKFLSPGARG